MLLVGHSQSNSDTQLFSDCHNTADCTQSLLWKNKFARLRFDKHGLLFYDN